MAAAGEGQVAVQASATPSATPFNKSTVGGFFFLRISSFSAVYMQLQVGTAIS